MSTATMTSSIKRFINLLKYDKKSIIYLYIYAIFTGLIGLSIPLGFQAIINLLTSAQVSTSWILLVIIVILGIASSGGLQIMQLYITENLQQRIFARASYEFAYRIPRMKIESLRNYYAPELINRFFDTVSIQKGVSKILIDFTQASLQIIFGLLLLSFYHPFFVLFGLLLIFILLTLFRFTSPKGLQTSLTESYYKYEVVHWLEEVARTLNTFKLTGKTKLPIEKTDKFVSHYIDARKKHFKVLVIQNAGIVIFKTVVVSGLLIMGSLLVFDQQINLGQFVAAEIIILLVVLSVEKLILSLETIYDILTSVEKLGMVTDIELESESGIEYNAGSELGGMSIKVNNLSYQFADAKTPVLKDVSFKIESGSKICLSGFSGSGKTTLIQILTGLLQNFSGSLSIDGIPIGNYQLRCLRSNMGESVSQQSIFYGTLEENITIGRENISFEDVKWAVEKVNLTEFVESLEMGYATLISPEGRKLPKSIVKKIVLARAIASKPKLLVLEESLSNFEKEDVEKIFCFLVNKQNPWTIITISNDPYIASMSDRVIVLDKGRMIDEAPYNDIKKKEYSDRLFNEPSSIKC